MSEDRPTPADPTADAPSKADRPEPKPDHTVVWAFAAIGILIMLGIVAMIVASTTGKSSDGPQPNPSATSVLDAYPDRTLPADPPAAPGTVAPVEVKLSATCADAVAPIRDLEKAQPSGASLNEAQIATTNDALAAARNLKVCSYDEYVDFTTKEMLPWRRMPAPTAPAVDTAAATPATPAQ